MKKRLLALTLALTVALGLAPAVAARETDAPGHWASSAIQTWVDRGVVIGDSEGMRPDDCVTRGELAKILACMLGLTREADNEFQDLDDQWYTPYILRCAAAGIMQGDAGGTIRPQDHITRQEAFVMVARTLKVGEADHSEIQFEDIDQTASWATGPINALINGGYLHGSGGRLKPLEHITRAEVLTVLDNLVTLYIQEPDTVVDLSGVEGIVVVAARNVQLRNAGSCRVINWIDEAEAPAASAAGTAHTHDYRTETVAPTCTKNGYTRHICTICGAYFDDHITEALGHDYYVDTIVPPTSVQPGYTQYVCARCGDTYRDEETRLFTSIFPCDTLPEGMTGGTVVTEKSEGVRPLYSDAAIRSTGGIVLDGSITPVDLSDYEDDGVVHLYVYAEDGADASPLTISVGNTVWTVDSITSGWNELWLPLEEGQGETEWSHVTHVAVHANSRTSQTFLVDELEIWHSADLPTANRGTLIYDCDTILPKEEGGRFAMVLTAEEAAARGITLKSAAALYHPNPEDPHGQIIAQTRFAPVDISDYADDGYLHFYLYVSDVSDVGIAGGLVQFRIELSSAGINDSQELQWDIKAHQTLQNGWNEIFLPLSAAGKTGTIDLSAVNFIRIYPTAAHGADLVVLVDEISVWHESELPQNAATHDDQAVRIAAAQVAGLDEITVRISTGSPEKEAVEAEIEKMVSEALEGTEHIYGVEVAVTYDTASQTAEILFYKNDASKSKYVKVHIVEYSLGARLVTPEYDSSERIVAEVVLGEEGSAYELDSTGQADATQVIQNALNECAAAGGGTVWLPAGRYRITGSLKIPSYVTLRGDYQDPDLVSNPEYGTILLADVKSVSEGNSEPLIRVGGAAGAVGLTVYYPNQSMDAVKDYQYTFYTEGRGDGRSDQMLPTIRNCTLINAYRGIGMCDHLDGTLVPSYSQEQATILNVKGTFLFNMLTERNGSDVGTIVGLTANSSYWANACAGLTRADAREIEAYTRTHGTAVVLGDLEGYMFADLNIRGYKTGIRTEIEQGARAHFYGGFYRVTVADCGTALELADVYPGDSVNIAASTLEGSDYSIRKITEEGSVKLTDVKLTGAVVGTGVVTADNDAADLSSLWQGYDAQPAVPAANLVVLDQLDTTAAEDVSAAIQQGLDSLSGKGGVVYLPAGHYRLEHPLTIPAGVELRGATYSTPVRPEREADGGTVLEIRFGYDTTQADTDYFACAGITLGGDAAGVNGLILAYREQTTAADSYVPTAYAVYGKDVSGVYVVNSAIVAPSHGIFLDGCDGHLLQGLTTSCYENIITVKNSSGGSIQRVLQNVTLTARNAWDWSDWTDSTDGLNLTAENLDCLIFENAEEAVFACFDYRGHNTFLSKASDLQVVNSGSGGDSDGYIFSVDGGSVIGVNITSTRTARKPLRYRNQPDVRLYSRSTRSNMAERAFVTPDWNKLNESIYILQDCDGQIPAGGVRGLVESPAREGGAWQLGGNQLLLSWPMTEVDLTPYEDGAIHLWLYSETENSTDSLSFLLSSSGTAKKNYACWPVSHLKAGWNEIWLPLSDVRVQTGGLDLSAVNYMEITASNPNIEVVLDEIGAAPAAVVSGSLTMEQSRMIMDCDMAPSAISTVITQSEAPEGVTLPSEKALLHNAAHNGYSAERQIIAQGPIAAVDISDYGADGWLHFWLYVEDAAQLGGGFTRLLLSSVVDLTNIRNALYWHLEDFITLESGWNEIWLPLEEGTAMNGAIDLSAVGLMRLYTTQAHGEISFILDELEVIHKAYVPQSVLQPAPTKMIMNCDSTGFFSTLNGMTVTNEEGCYVQGNGALASSGWSTVIGSGVFASPVNIKDYESGYVHVSFYVEDVSKLGATVNLELSSSGRNDAEEKEFVFSSAKLQNGWNELWFSIPGTTSGVGPLDLSAVNFFRLFSVGGSDTTVILDNIYAALEQTS